MADAILAQSGVYTIRNQVNSKVYIGSTVHFGKRWRTHKRQLREGLHSNKKLQLAWIKYGESSFHFDILEVVPDRAQIRAREQFWLDSRKPFDRAGYNIRVTVGSSAGMKLSEEHKLRISAANKGRKRSPEVRLAISIANKLRPPRSEETKSKVSDALKGRKPTAETRAKQSESAKGRVMSDEARAKMSLAKKGKPRTPSQIAAQRAAVASRVYSPELRAIYAAAGKKSAYPRTDEYRARMSAIKKQAAKDSKLST